MKSIDKGDFIEQIDWRLLNKLEEVIFENALLSKEYLDKEIESSNLKLAKNLMENWDLKSIMRNYLYYRFNWSMTIEEKIFPLQRITWLILRYYISEKNLSQKEIHSIILDVLNTCSVVTIHWIHHYISYLDNNEKTSLIYDLTNESYWKVIDILSWNNK